MYRRGKHFTAIHNDARPACKSYICPACARPRFVRVDRGSSGYGAAVLRLVLLRYSRTSNRKIGYSYSALPADFTSPPQCFSLHVYVPSRTVYVASYCAT